MNDTVKRFKKRKHLAKKNERTTVFRDNSAEVSINAMLSSARLDMTENLPVETVDADTLVTNIHEHLNSEKIDALIASCQRECLEAVVRPLGIAKVLFDDKLGGNVDTIHNVRTGVYATNREKLAYEKRGEYDDKSKPPKERTKNIVHQDARYIEGNRVISEKLKDGGVSDSYAGVKRTLEDRVDQDHVISAKQTHDDPGRVLAEEKTTDAANLKENLAPTDRSINRSKGAKTPEEFASWLENTAQDRRNRITNLRSRSSISDKEQKELHKLEKLEQTNLNMVRKIGRTAQKSQDELYNKKYYKSTKFVGSSVKTSLHEGGKMALQQALGVLMEEFVRATFAEVRDAWKNGFKGKVDDSFLDALKERLVRVASRVQSKWKDAAFALRDGFISGFLSNLVTVLINTFATTAARFVGMVREGIMSLYRAMTTLLFPEEGVSTAQAADAALKIIAAALVTSGGAALEGAIDPYIKGLGPLGDYALSIVIGLATGCREQTEMTGL